MKKILIYSIVILSMGLTSCSAINKVFNGAASKLSSTNTTQTSSDKSTSAQQAQKPVVNQQPSIESQISYYFPRAGQHTAQTIIDLINSSKSSLDIAMSGMIKSDIVDAIIASKSRGVNVRIITDKQDSKDKTQLKELTLIKKASIPVKVNAHIGSMDLKTTIVDKSVITAGSYDFVPAATFENDVVLIVIRNPKIAGDFDTEFDSMWNDTVNYKDFLAG